MQSNATDIKQDKTAHIRHYAPALRRIVKVVTNLKPQKGQHCEQCL